MNGLNNTRPRRARRSGFTLIEVALSLVVFLMMTLVFAAVFPMAVRAAKFSNNYSQAAMLAQHKIDQLRAAGISKLDYADLSSQGIVDTMTTPPSSLPATYTFTTVDNIASTGTTTGYFPTGSTGTLTVRDYNAYVTGQGSACSVPAGVMDYVTVTLNWSGAGVSTGTYSLSAIIIRMPHQ